MRRARPTITSDGVQMTKALCDTPIWQRRRKKWASSSACDKVLQRLPGTWRMGRFRQGGGRIACRICQPGASSAQTQSGSSELLQLAHTMPPSETHSMPSAQNEVSKNDLLKSCVRAQQEGAQLMRAGTKLCCRCALLQESALVAAPVVYTAACCHRDRSTSRPLSSMARTPVVVPRLCVPSDRPSSEAA